MSQRSVALSGSSHLAVIREKSERRQQGDLKRVRILKGRLHLLVSSLDGAVSLVEVDDISEFIACGEKKSR